MPFSACCTGVWRATCAAGSSSVCAVWPITSILAESALCIYVCNLRQQLRPSPRPQLQPRQHLHLRPSRWRLRPLREHADRRRARLHHLLRRYILKHLRPDDLQPRRRPSRHPRYRLQIHRAARGHLCADRQLRRAPRHLAAPQTLRTLTPCHSSPSLRQLPHPPPSIANGASVWSPAPSSSFPTAPSRSPTPTCNSSAASSRAIAPCTKTSPTSRKPTS